VTTLLTIPILGSLQRILGQDDHVRSLLASVVTQGVIACRYNGIEARFQVPQLAELADDPMADLRDDRGNIGIGGRLACDKAWREARLSAIEVDAFKEDAMEMEVGVRRRLYLIF
jgi:hypothetical protein